MLTRADQILEFKFKAESCFAIACAEQDATRRRQFLNWALYWFRHAEQQMVWRDAARASPRPFRKPPRGTALRVLDSYPDLAAAKPIGCAPAPADGALQSAGAR